MILIKNLLSSVFSDVYVEIVTTKPRIPAHKFNIRIKEIGLKIFNIDKEKITNASPGIMSILKSLSARSRPDKILCPKGRLTLTHGKKKKTIIIKDPIIA